MSDGNRDADDPGCPTCGGLRMHYGLCRTHETVKAENAQLRARLAEQHAAAICHDACVAHATDEAMQLRAQLAQAKAVLRELVAIRDSAPNIHPLDGRAVRAWRRAHVLLADLPDAPKEKAMTKFPHDHRAFLELSFAQEREKLVKRLWQIRQDVDSYNENQAEPAGLAPLVFVFDFRADMDELDAVRVRRARTDLPDALKEKP